MAAFAEDRVAVNQGARFDVLDATRLRVNRVGVACPFAILAILGESPRARRDSS